MKKYIILLLLPILTYASIGKITALKGDVTIKRDAKIMIAKTGTELEKHDFISTSKKGKVQIVFKDRTIFTVGKNSTLDIADYLYDEKQPKSNKAQFNVLKGAFSSITGRIGKLNKSKFKLKTKSASIGIRGTIVKANQEVVICTQGAITVTTPNGKTVQVNAGEKTDVSSGTPTTPTAIQQGDIATLSSLNNKQIASAQIQNTINNLDNQRNSTNTVHLEYNGNVYGTTTNGGDIIVDNNNKINVNFELGGGQNKMDGNIKFDTQNGQKWATGFEGTTSDSSFQSNLIKNVSVQDGTSTSSVTQGSGNVDGKFIGSNKESIDGTFNIVHPSSEQGSATGTFKATK